MSRFDLMVMKDQLERKWSFNSQLGKATSHEILKHHGVEKVKRASCLWEEYLGEASEEDTLEINRLISIKIVALFHSMKEFQDALSLSHTHTHAIYKINVRS